jgi:hypothetical protein
MPMERDDGNHRRHDIGRVEAAAHAGFDHGDLHLLVAKMGEGERRGELEKRRIAHAVAGDVGPAHLPPAPTAGPVRHPKYRPR